MPGGAAPIQRDTFLPRHLDGVDSSIFFENTEQLASYHEILHCRQIELTIQHALLDPVLTLTVEVNGAKRQYIDPSRRWRFNPLENATHCPDPSRVLQHEHGAKPEKWSLRIIEAEELSNSGIISWLAHVLKD